MKNRVHCKNNYQIRKQEGLKRCQPTDLLESNFTPGRNKKPKPSDEDVTTELTVYEKMLRGLI